MPGSTMAPELAKPGTRRRSSSRSERAVSQVSSAVRLALAQEAPASKRSEARRMGMNGRTRHRSNISRRRGDTELRMGGRPSARAGS